MRPASSASVLLASTTTAITIHSVSKTSSSPSRTLATVLQPGRSTSSLFHPHRHYNRRQLRQQQQQAHRHFHAHACSPFLHHLLGSSSSDAAPRVLTTRKRLPYPRHKLFRLVASVDQYPLFLPFITSSRVLSRDENGWPKLAMLDVGYRGLSERFTSRVECDGGGRFVRARSGGDADADGNGEGLFRALDTLWKFEEVSTGGEEGSAIRDSGQGSRETEAELTVSVKFRNPAYDALLAAVEGQVAGSMMRAFERRLMETDGR